MIKLFRMKKTLSRLSIIILSLYFAITAVYADEATLTISGSNSTHSGEFLVITVTANGTDLFNISGTVNYPCDDMVLFEIIPSEVLGGWIINFNYDSAGTIDFNAITNSKDTAINNPTVLFTAKFVILDTNKTQLEITTTDMSSSCYTVEEVVTNQKEIDAKTAERNACGLNEDCLNSVKVPDPIVKKIETESVGPVDSYVFTANVYDKSSDNSFLKEAEFKNAVMSPSFSKMITKYTIQIDENIDLDYNFVAERPTSTVQVSKEVNGQIVVSVTSEDGGVTSYIFNINRIKKNRDHTGQEANNMATNIIPGQLSSTTLYLLIALVVVGLGIIAIGGYYVYQGSHIDVVDEQ